MKSETVKNPQRGKPKERGNGRGSVRQLPSGRWRWAIRLDGVHHSGTQANKTLAEKEIARVVTDHKRGVLAAPDKTTVRVFATAWLERQKDIREATRIDYALNLKYAFEFLGDLKIKDVRPTHIKDALNKLKARAMQGGRDGKPMSRRTLGMVRARLRSGFDEAVSDQLIYTNPVISVKRAKAEGDDEDVKGQALTEEQAARFREIGTVLHAAGVARLWPALCIGLTVGFRRGEIMGLRWSDVDFDKKLLKVRQNLTEVKGIPKIGKPKTKRSIRDVPIPPGLQAVLEVHKLEQQTEYQLLERSWDEGAPVFATVMGTYCAPSNLLRACKGILEWSSVEPLMRRRDTGKRDEKGKKIWENIAVSFDSRLKAIPVDYRAQLTAIARDGDPLPDVRVHDLRHTFATLALRSGARIERVSKILGHASTSITTDVYQHVTLADLEESVFDLFVAPVHVRDVPAITLN
jgi:integrase